MKHTIRFSVLSLAASAALLAMPAVVTAQTTGDKDFTWSGKIPEGRWITVHNLNGTVEVTPSSSDKVEVVATKHVRRGDPDYVRFEVRKFGPSGQDVSICALWGENSDCDEDGYHGRNNSGRWGRENEISVEFQVRVPKGVRVGAHSVNGEVSVRDVASEVEAESVNGSVDVSTLSGPVNASTVNGSVRASMGKFDLNSDLTFSSVNGTVIAEFADELNADVDLSTVNGRFLTDYPVTITGRIDPKRLRATLGKGGPRIHMSTVNGNVELRKR
ncbi:MAG TPA: DUF4097 family beta strand repeat-containing protein [Gemmatimonadaceae bacterium]|nr:DUF4097 family beta strand repeat-containing protein [Gemmatimonadaceae bacterium]